MPGTAETLTSTDFDVRARDVEITPNTPVDDEAAKIANGNHAETESLSGAQSAQVTVSVPLHGSGTVSTAPKYAKMLNACGIDSVTYTTTGIGFVRRKSKDCAPLTIWVQEQRVGTNETLTHKVKGAVGDLTLSVDGIGGAIMLNFTFTGAYQGEVEGLALLTLTGADTTLGEKLLNTALTFGGDSLRISSFSYALGNNVQPVIDQSDATGYAYYYISASQPRLSINPLKISPATKDIYSEYKNETTQTALVTMQNFTLKVPVAQIISPAQAAREGLAAWDLNIKALENLTVDATLTAEDTFELLYGARA